MTRREFFIMAGLAAVAAALRLETQARADRPTIPGGLPSGCLPGCLPLCLATARPQRVYVYVPFVKGS